MNRIKDLRRERGHTQNDLANELQTVHTAISKYERGELDLSSTTICKICDIYGVTADYLLGRSSRPDPELTPEEEQLLAAWNAAPPEIRAIIDTALSPYKKDAIASAPTA